MKKTIKIFSIISLVLLVALGIFFFTNPESAPGTLSKEESQVQETEGSKNTNATVTIVAVGDSLTAGYNLPLADSYPNILEQRLRQAGENVEVINAGISGETTAGLLERAQFVAQQKPDMVLITIGGNDAFRNLPLENTRKNIQQTIKIFKQSVKAENIYLMKIEAPANLGQRYRKEFNALYKEIADVEKVNVVPFVSQEVFFDQSKLLPDGIHPNKKGYEFIVDSYIFPVIFEKVTRM